MFRHFIERNDFEVKVASASRATGATVSSVEIRVMHPLERLRRSRFVRLAHNFGYLWNWRVLPAALLREAKMFHPDVVFTVPDNWHCGLAWQLARRLQVPLVVNFQDLFPFSQFLHASERPLPGIDGWLANRFRFLNRKANLAFYTSEGMRDWFGGHPNGHVLYPVGDASDAKRGTHLPTPSGPWTIVYAGNCYGAYGRMLLALAHEVQNRPQLRLQIFAAGNDWPSDVVEAMRTAGIFMGFRPFEELKLYMAAADAFLTVMSFEKAEEPFVRTSFTTKWLDYAPYGRPIIVWAPAYSTASGFACATGAGIAMDDPCPEAAVCAIESLLSNPARCLEAGCSAARVAGHELNSERLHGLLRTQLQALVE